MQVTPVGFVEASLPNLALTAEAQQQFATAAVAQSQSSISVVQEKHSAAKAKITEPAEYMMPSERERIWQSASVNARSGTSTEQAHPMVVRELFDYLIAIEKEGGAGEADDLTDLIKSALNSVGRALEEFQGAYAETKLGAVLNKGELSSSGNNLPDASDKKANASADKRGNGEREDMAIETILERYIQVSWASLRASLAANAVTSALSSVNTLVKQP